MRSFFQRLNNYSNRLFSTIKRYNPFAHSVILNPAISAEEALLELKLGNQRFLNNQLQRRSLKHDLLTGQLGQRPIAFILGCMDSRVPPEIIFDQGIGDIFTVRVAGNVVNTDNLSSMKFANVIIDTPLIVVLGHTRCGAVEAASKDNHSGRLQSLIDKIKPAVDLNREQLTCCRDSQEEFELLNQISRDHALLQAKSILEKSKSLSAQVENHVLRIVAALYDVDTGRVEFLDEDVH